MKRLVPIVILAMLLVALISPPGAAQKVDLPEEPIALAGVTTFGAIEARTGEYAGDPGLPPLPDGTTSWILLSIAVTSPRRRSR